MDAQCISNTTRVCLKALEKHFFLLWRVKQGEEKNGAQAKNVAMHLCVCLITLILALIICNLSNLSLYRVLSGYQA